jgi:DNA-binding HxlR family transcriptional regulator
LESCTETTTTLIGRPIEALLLVRLLDGPKRFGELADILVRGSGTKTVPSDRMLAGALARLTADGDVRQRRPTDSDSFVYELTGRGRRRACGIAQLIEEALGGYRHPAEQ